MRDAIAAPVRRFEVRGSCSPTNRVALLQARRVGWAAYWPAVNWDLGDGVLRVEVKLRRATAWYLKLNAHLGSCCDGAGCPTARAAEGGR